MVAIRAVIPMSAGYQCTQPQQPDVTYHRDWCAEHRHDAVAGELFSVPPERLTTAVQRSSCSAMISRNRSAPTAAAMSIE
jgi:hypothetical protein